MPYVRVDAALALWRIEGNLDEVLPLLSQIVKNQDGADPDLRRFALAALGQIGPPAREAIPVIMEASEDEFPSIRAAASLALCEIRGRIPKAVENSKSQSPMPK